MELFVLADRLAEDLIEFAALVVLCAVAIALRRGRAHYGWLALALLAFWIDAALLSRAYGVIAGLPFFAASNWTWSGKIYAFLALLVLLALIPGVGLRAAGVTLRQRAGGWIAGGIPTLALCGALLYAAMRFDPAGFQGDWDALAFQATMPGLEEELFYRGALLLFLDRAFGAPARLLGAPLGWGLVISAAMFGLAHGLSVSSGAAAFSVAPAAYTFAAGLGLGWIRARTGSLLMPVFIHNFGNAIFYIV